LLRDRKNPRKEAIGRDFADLIAASSENDPRYLSGKQEFKRAKGVVEAKAAKGIRLIDGVYETGNPSSCDASRLPRLSEEASREDAFSI
jgi:hypothetical protein